MCTGEEENLLECSRVPELNVGESDCTHFENAGVRCEGIDLVVKNNILLTISCIIRIRSSLTKCFPTNDSPQHDLHLYMISESQ